DPRGIPYYWIGGPPPSGLAVEGTDFHAVVNRRIAVTPIQLDLTARKLLKRLRTWDWSVTGVENVVPAAPVAAASAASADGSTPGRKRPSAPDRQTDRRRRRR